MTRNIASVARRQAEDPSIPETMKRNHLTEHALEAKREAKTRGNAGRFRGKAKAKQNNKARGGKMAR